MRRYSRIVGTGNDLPPRRVSNDELAAQLARQGVDVSHVHWDDTARMGTFFLELGSPPRPSAIIYDRKGSAASQMQPEVDGPEKVPHAIALQTVVAGLGVDEQDLLAGLHAAVDLLGSSILGT